MRGLSLCSVAVASIGLLALSPSALGQLTDLQSGRNFPTASQQFGTNRTENIDVGDVDNDGDLDVVVANGGDFGNEPNRIFINNGGLQGGTVGTFSEQTSSRFAGVPSDTSRDIELADIDNDGDLDVYVSNRGSNSAGQVSRFYVNLGGLQGGTVGFYSEDTANRWGSLASVPAGDQEFGGNNGPWRDWSCDCDFADLDDDGDLDLFHSSYGPSIGGNRPSRVFLNDGAGVFDELFPWIDSGADIDIHTLDIDLVDLDGDYDFDIVASSRNSQARVYMNNLYDPTTGSSQLFTDTTQASLINTGSTLSGTSNYEGEFGDTDGDGDFDIWMKNYASFTDKILVNNGTNGSGAVLFSESDGPGPNLIKGDPNVDENEIDFLDFDGDGDLDAFLANFSGTNAIYVGGNAQGLTGQFHNSTGQGDSSYPQNETPSSSNSGTTLDGEVGDMDNDGDQDLLLGNDSNQVNRYWENVGGIPDVHAPTIPLVSHTVGTPNTPGNLVIHAQLRDNAPYYLIAYHEVVVTYQPGNVAVPMFSQASQQFRAEIPGSATEYSIAATDLTGNVGSAGPFVLGPPPVDPYTDLGCADGGVSGDPVLDGTGTLDSGTGASIDLTSAAPSAPAVLFIGLGPAGAGIPFKGGTLKPIPMLFSVSLATSAGGNASLPFVTPAGLSGLTTINQFAIVDAAASSSVALSNALQADFP